MSTDLNNSEQQGESLEEKRKVPDWIKTTAGGMIMLIIFLTTNVWTAITEKAVKEYEVNQLILHDKDVDRQISKLSEDVAVWKSQLGTLSTSMERLSRSNDELSKELNGLRNQIAKLK